MFLKEYLPAKLSRSIFVSQGFQDLLWKLEITPNISSSVVGKYKKDGWFCRECSKHLLSELRVLSISGLTQSVQSAQICFKWAIYHLYFCITCQTFSNIEDFTDFHRSSVGVWLQWNYDDFTMLLLWFHHHVSCWILAPIFKFQNIKKFPLPFKKTPCYPPHMMCGGFC